MTYDCRFLLRDKIAWHDRISAEQVFLYGPHNEACPLEWPTGRLNWYPIVIFRCLFIWDLHIYCGIICKWTCDGVVCVWIHIRCENEKQQRWEQLSVEVPNFARWGFCCRGLAPSFHLPVLSILLISCAVTPWKRVVKVFAKSFWYYIIFFSLVPLQSYNSDGAADRGMIFMLKQCCPGLYKLLDSMRLDLLPRNCKLYWCVTLVFFDGVGLCRSVLDFLGVALQFRVSPENV